MTSINAPKTPYRIIPSFSEEQAAALLAVCGDDFTGIRDKAILLLLIDCGIRAAELLSLRMESIDTLNGSFTVLGKGSKERQIPFGVCAKAALRDYLRRRESVDCPTLIVSQFGEALTYSGLVQMIRRRGARAGLPKSLLHPHVFRHTAALLYLRAGGDCFSLQKILGHSDLSMTRRYCELTQSKMILMSLLYTARVRGMDPVASLEQMLLGTPMFP